MRAALIALALLGLWACSASDTWSDRWQRYTVGLARLLDREPGAAVAIPPYPHAPRGKALQQPFSVPDINLLEFLRLGHCKLGQTLAQRNSILGKHGDAAARLIFDLHYLAQVDDCIALLAERDQPALSASLQQAKAIKVRELPRRIFAATLAGPEFRQLWSAPDREMLDTPEGDDIAVAALARWARWQRQWLQGNWAAGLDNNGARLLETLGQIRQGRGGQLLQAQRIAIAGLSRASDIIQQRLQGRPLCLRPQPTPTARYFQALLYNQFVQNLQPQAATLYRQQQQLRATLATLEQPLLQAMDTVPDAYLAWQSQREQLFDQATQAHRQHVTDAGALLSQCGLSPGEQQP